MDSAPRHGSHDATIAKYFSTQAIFDGASQSFLGSRCRIPNCDFPRCEGERVGDDTEDPRMGTPAWEPQVFRLGDSRMDLRTTVTSPTQFRDVELSVMPFADAQMND